MCNVYVYASVHVIDDYMNHCMPQSFVGMCAWFVYVYMWAYMYMFTNRLLLGLRVNCHML